MVVLLEGKLFSIPSWLSGFLPLILQVKYLSFFLPKKVWDTHKKKNTSWKLKTQLSKILGKKRKTRFSHKNSWASFWKAKLWQAVFDLSFSNHWHNRILIVPYIWLVRSTPSKVFLTLIPDQSKVSECVLVVWTWTCLILRRLDVVYPVCGKKVTWLQVVTRCVTLITW